MKHILPSIRHMRRRKVYALVIVMSLALSFACANLLVSFVVRELHTDSFHAHRDRIFQVMSDNPFGGEGRTAFILDNVTQYIVSTYAGVAGACRLSDDDKLSMAREGQEVQPVQLVEVDTTFFSMFTFPLAAGDIRHALDGESVVLTPATARRFFGAETAVGKSLILHTGDTARAEVSVVVSGVLAEPADQTQLKFEALIRRGVLKDNRRGGATYLQLEPGVDAHELMSRINADPKRPGLLGPGKSTYTVVPLKEAYFNMENTLPYTRVRNMLFIWTTTVVAGLIFFIAGFNFINLFLLSLQERRKSTGIKKTLGVSIGHLVAGSAWEVCLYILSAFVLSLAITPLLLPSFNEILGASVTFTGLLSTEVLALLIAAMALLGLTVVVCATWQQWRSRPVSLMKQQGVTRVAFAKVFFLVQFVVSVTLITCATVIYRQMEYLEHEPLGFNRNILQLRAVNHKVLPAFKDKLLQLPGVRHVAVGGGNPISGNMIMRLDLENGEFYTPYIFSGDEDLIRTLGLTLLQGTWSTTDPLGKVVNETFVKTFGLTNPIGQAIPGMKGERIMGVVKDFTCGSFKQQIPPVMISFTTDGRRLLIDYTGHTAAGLIPEVQKAWKALVPNEPLDYAVLQEDLLNKYKEERFFYRVIVVSAFVSMLISCFGLFALSWSVIQSRVKEIGIRKVMGATAGDVVKLLTGDFAKQVLLAFALSVPVAYFIAYQWLDHFVRKIALSPVLFLVSGLIAMLIAAVTLSVHTLRAARLNPVDELRSE